MAEAKEIGAEIGGNAAQLRPPKHSVDLEMPVGDEKTPIDSDAKANSSDTSERDVAKENNEKDEKKGGLADYFRIFRYCQRPDWILYAIACVCEIASGAALPLMTLIFGRFTTVFTNFALGQAPVSEFKSAVNQLALYFVYLAIARFAVIYVATFCVNIAAIRTTRSVRTSFLEHTLRQEVWHFDKQNTGSISTQVTTNGNRINQGIAEKLGLLVQGLALFISSFIVALSVQWKLALIVMSIIPAIFLLSAVCISIIAKNESKIVRIYSEAAVTAQDAISSIRTIHAFGAQREVVQRYDKFLAEALALGHKQAPIFGVLFGGQNFIVTSGTALAFWQGYRMYRTGEIAEVGTVLTVVLRFVQFIVFSPAAQGRRLTSQISVTLGATSMSTIAPQLQAITNAASAAAELFGIIDKKSLLDPLDPSGNAPSSCTGHIEVRDLRFAYPSRPSAQVLRGLTLSIPAGKTTALVGASGCGKSTLIGLLERWYEPASGHILLDGTDLTSYNTKWLRSHIRLVQQEPVLFSGTVLENVKKGLIGSQLELNDEDQMALIVEACKASNAHEFINELPEGYHTQVGERASMLSGGQKQRIAIARSIVSDPKILLLDEATSALDPRAERVVQEALNRVSKDKTTLIIAHKLATVKKADNIAVMSFGLVVEQGTHAELIARGGQYAAMVTSQNLGSEAGEPDFQDEVKDEENELSLQQSTLQRTKTQAASVSTDAELKHLTSETAGYSLLRSILVMFREQKDQYFYLFLAIVFSLMAGGAYPAQAILFSHLISVFTIRGDGQSQADFWALMFFVLAIVNLISYFGIGFVSSGVAQVITRRYRKEMIERILNFDQDFFDRPENASGALTSKLSSLPTSLQELISANSILIIVVVVNVLSSSLLGIAYGWKLGLVIVFGGMPLLVLSGYYRIQLEQRLENKAGERFASSAGLATEAVTSIRTVSSLTLEEQILKQYSGSLNGIVRSSIRSLSLTLVPYALSQSLEFCIQALGFWYGSQLMASGEYTTTQFFIIFIAVIFGGQAAGEFFGYTTSITKAKVAANYILWLRTIKAKIGETEETNGIGPKGDGPIAIDDVEFRYKQRDSARVLRGVNMKIESGTYAAFVGPSGCGKSTLVALLERFYDPIRGRITLNEQDIKEMSPHLYRQHMSLVQQEPPLYQSSVRDNIALGLEQKPSDEEVRTACEQANAWEFISSLPEGLNTPCGSKGLQFSGGQRQRIAVARALIRNPRLLLLDEATSALDTQSERIVQKALDEAASMRTTIAVAHRLSTIRHADVIFVMADGKIVEQGKHEELLALKGRYHAMCLAQSLDQEQGSA